MTHDGVTGRHVRVSEDGVVNAKLIVQGSIEFISEVEASKIEKVRI